MTELQTLLYYMQYFSKWLGLPAGLLASIATQESSFNPDSGYFDNSCNNVNACGLMQLKPIALADIKRVFRIDIDPLNPIQAVMGAAAMFYINRKYLRSAGIWFPSIEALVVAYNGGWVQGRNYEQNQPVTLSASNYLASVVDIYNSTYA